jgi:hypothetical protein
MAIRLCDSLSPQQQSVPRTLQDQLHKHCLQRVGSPGHERNARQAVVPPAGSLTSVASAWSPKDQSL